MLSLAGVDQDNLTERARSATRTRSERHQERLSSGQTCPLHPSARHTQDMAQLSRRPGWALRLVVTILVTVVGFVVPFAIVQAIVSELMPLKHDMSDMTRGLMILMLATIGGVVGALVTYSMLRWRRRESLRDQRSTDS